MKKMIPYKEQQKNQTLNNYTHSHSTEDARQGVKKMSEEEKVHQEAVEEIASWEDAIDSGDYVHLEEDKPVDVVITNWKLVKCMKFGEEQVEFRADVVEEDGKACEKKLTTVSNRLKAKLRPLLENSEPVSKIKLKITRIGDKFNTNYSVIKE